MTDTPARPLMKGGSESAIFVSYCWTSAQHCEWVVRLANLLVSHGVRTVLDIWDLNPGQDKYAFMEKAVLDPTITKVLIICDEGYKERADNRERGVGTETQLISPEVYGKVDQEKFIPIIAQRGNEGEPLVPTYLASRVYIDLSDETTFETEYQKLLRNIYGQPERYLSSQMRQFR